MSYLGDGIAALALSVTTLATRKKWKVTRDERRAAKTRAYVDAKVEQLDEMRKLRTNVEWIMKQFGESPNGGGIMQQLKEHIDETKENFKTVQVEQKQHLLWHMEANK